MKRKVLSTLLSISMAAVLLAGCGNSATPTEGGAVAESCQDFRILEKII